MSPAAELPTRLPDYFPPAVGRYEVKPGLLRFGKEMGGGRADGHVFQLDATFPRFRQEKLAARAERLDKYFQTRRFDRPVERAIVRFIVARLLAEHPGLFSADADGSLACGPSGERLRFDDEMTLLGVESPDPLRPPYASGLDALACQVQEDLAVVSTDEDGHWLSALHVCVPNHWAAEDKIGKPFASIHEPVAGMERMNRQGEHLVRVMVGATAGLVRFAWGVTCDDRLNHHPDVPPGVARVTCFDPNHPAAFVRVERQTIWGFPDVGAALFTIRPYLHDCAAIRRDPLRAAQLASALASMSAASLEYKGLSDSRDELLRWLEPSRGTS